jgi:hypothetical protein
MFNHRPGQVEVATVSSSHRRRIRNPRFYKPLLFLLKMAVTEPGNAMLPSSFKFLGFNWEVFRATTNATLVEWNDNTALVLLLYSKIGIPTYISEAAIVL